MNKEMKKDRDIKVVHLSPASITLDIIDGYKNGTISDDLRKQISNLLEKIEKRRSAA